MFNNPDEKSQLMAAFTLSLLNENDHLVEELAEERKRRIKAEMQYEKLRYNIRKLVRG